MLEITPMEEEKEKGVVIDPMLNVTYVETLITMFVAKRKGKKSKFVE